MRDLKNLKKSTGWINFLWTYLAEIQRFAKREKTESTGEKAPCMQKKRDSKKWNTSPKNSWPKLRHPHTTIKKDKKRFYKTRDYKIFICPQIVQILNFIFFFFFVACTHFCTSHDKQYNQTITSHLLLFCVVQIKSKNLTYHT